MIGSPTAASPPSKTPLWQSGERPEPADIRSARGMESAAKLARDSLGSSYSGEVSPTKGTDEGSSRRPLILGSLPILANLLFNNSSYRSWIELVILALLMAWVYYVLEAPWKAFYNSRRLLYSKSERLYIVMIFASPWIAAYSIQLAKGWASVSEAPSYSLLNDFSVPLFMLTAMLRPFTWLFKDLALSSRNRSNCEYDEVKELRYKMGKLMDRLDRQEQRQSDGTPGEPGSRGISEKELDKMLHSLGRSLEKRLLRLEQQVAALQDGPPHETSIVGLGCQLGQAIASRILSFILIPWRMLRMIV